MKLEQIKTLKDFKIFQRNFNILVDHPDAEDYYLSILREYKEIDDAYETGEERSLVHRRIKDLLFSKETLDAIVNRKDYSYQLLFRV